MARDHKQKGLLVAVLCVSLGVLAWVGDGVFGLRSSTHRGTVSLTDEVQELKSDGLEEVAGVAGELDACWGRRRGGGGRGRERGAGKGERGEGRGC